jgi:hypothetical protein
MDVEECGSTEEVDILLDIHMHGIDSDAVVGNEDQSAVEGIQCKVARDVAVGAEAAVDWRRVDIENMIDEQGIFAFRPLFRFLEMFVYVWEENLLETTQLVPDTIVVPFLLPRAMIMGPLGEALEFPFYYSYRCSK